MGLEYATSWPVGLARNLPILVAATSTLPAPEARSILTRSAAYSSRFQGPPLGSASPPTLLPRYTRAVNSSDGFSAAPLVAPPNRWTYSSTGRPLGKAVTISPWLSASHSICRVRNRTSENRCGSFRVVSQTHSLASPLSLSDANAKYFESGDHEGSQLFPFPPVRFLVAKVLRSTTKMSELTAQKGTPVRGNQSPFTSGARSRLRTAYAAHLPSGDRLNERKPDHAAISMMSSTRSEALGSSAGALAGRNASTLPSNSLFTRLEENPDTNAPCRSSAASEPCC